MAASAGTQSQNIYGLRSASSLLYPRCNKKNKPLTFACGPVIPSLPDDTLSYIFEAGHTSSNPSFESLVAQVMRRWRGVLLSTPNFWIHIYIPPGAKGRVTRPRSICRGLEPCLCMKSQK
ncbi:hypothetical protein PILCRDRAFT_812800 [Piloderma croceum F 1598]|uniref:Uncharacterized protein n=1 Tax=Piloderma croceum (strain F 1598) TaxID=765440 RepID=A0A0C3BTW6_PILCF|nr:hypothetical protein PILCRDRAFT_812800 [Piloderma croceum F 1598]